MAEQKLQFMQNGVFFDWKSFEAELKPENAKKNLDAISV